MRNLTERGRHEAFPYHSRGRIIERKFVSLDFIRTHTAVSTAFPTYNRALSLCVSSDNPWRPATRQAFAFVLNGSSHSIHKLIFVVSRHFSVSYFFLIGVLYSFLSIFQLFGESLILFFLFRVMLEFLVERLERSCLQDALSLKNL